jgi:acyl-CoA synthetase (AMP-forming)/AMP-acid ligase II
VPIHRFDPDAGAPLDWSKVPALERRLSALLAWGSATHGQNELLVFDQDRISYAEADERSALLARRLLAAGVTKGSRVGMVYPNSLAFLVTWFALTRIGAVAVPISTFSSGEELAKIIVHADLSCLISVDRYLHNDYVSRLAESVEGLSASTCPHQLPAAPFLRELWIDGLVPSWARQVPESSSPAASEELLAAAEAQVTPADPMTIIYTSGSTAEPKGVIHSHASILEQGARLAASYPYRATDRIYTPMPFFWVGGMTLNLLNAMFVGATILASSATSPADTLGFLERERCSFYVAWPHAARVLEEHPGFAGFELSSMRGGMLQSLVPEADRLPPWDVFANALGMTETAGPHTIAQNHSPEHLAGTFGVPMPGMEHRIVDPDTGEDLNDGERGVLLVRGSTLMMGMVKREPSRVFEVDGWYKTGDLCSFREGHLFFHGRVDDMIKTAGSNVTPAEVVAAISAMPGVVQVFVTGIPDEDRGAIVGAVVTPEPGLSLTVEEVRAHARAQLSSFKVPRVILVVPAAELPMRSSGKVDRLLLIERLREAAGSA